MRYRRDIGKIQRAGVLGARRPERAEGFEPYLVRVRVRVRVKDRVRVRVRVRGRGRGRGRGA